jgi:monofunctional biosynthetic peptidoglycan transglycosylase
MTDGLRPGYNIPLLTMKETLKKALWIVPAGVLALVLLFVVWNLFFPAISRLKTENPKTTSFIQYRLAQWKARGRKHGLTQRWVPLSRISPNLINAVIIAEDDKFWTHKGFDWQAIKEAYERNRKLKEVHWGGSTITQQLAKNLFLSPSRSLLRKAREAIYTWRLERALPKKRILELYLNVVEWGDGIFGAEAAASFYFQAHASSLSPGEAARLASILPAPRWYNPTSIRSSSYLDERSQAILEIMEKRGLFAPEEQEPALPPAQEPEIIKREPSPEESIHDQP